MCRRVAAALAALATLPLGLSAQGVRLCERIEAPMAYVAVDASKAAAGAGNPLAQLLAAPGLAGMLDGGPAASVFAFLRGVLTRADGEIELALLGVLPGALVGSGAEGLPLVVVRARLSAADAERMRAVLADPKTARELRTFRGSTIYTLVASDGEAGADAAARGPGRRLEAVVVGNDLVVANNDRGIDEALDDRTVAAPHGLAADPRYQRLLAQLQPTPGALVAFADWQRFGTRLASIGGMSGALLEWSGLGGADAVAAAVVPHGEAPDDLAFHSTVLLSFPEGAAINGWLDMVQSANSRQLIDELPVGGVGGCVFAVAPARVVEAASKAGGFSARVQGACGECGIDLPRVVRRLGQRGALQLLLLSDSTAAVTPAFALQAQSRKAASDIVDEIARAISEAPRGSERSPSHVDLADVGGLERLRLCAVEDLLVFTQEADAVPALAAARRERPRTRAAVDAAVGAALRAFGLDRSSRLGGLVHLDATGWFAAAVGNAPPARSGAPAIGLPLHHTGMLDVQTQERGALVRLQLLSSR